MKGFEAEHRPRLSLDTPVILLDDIVEILGLTDLDLGIVLFTEFFDPRTVGKASVYGNGPRLTVLCAGFFQKAIGCTGITLCC